LGIVLTPPHITSLFCDLAGVNKDSVIIDNCCGTGGFLISGLQKMIQLAKGNDIKIKDIRNNQIIGIEFQDDIYALAVSNMIIHGDGKSNIYRDDCFHLTELKDKFNPTIGLLNPPYKTRRGDTEELEFVLNNLQYLKQNGKCVAIIPMSCMIGKTSTQLELRRRLYQNHTVEAVMSMPEELFHNSKINMVTAAIVLTAHVPHPPGKKVWFGYWRNDGFVKVKKRGRVDMDNKWGAIREKWISAYNNREEKRYESVMNDVDVEDEWCAEAYLETDYSLIDEDMFKRSAQIYLAFRFLNNLLNFEKEISFKKGIFEPKLETVDTLFYVKNGLSSDKVEVFEDSTNEYDIRYLRPSQTYQGSIAGYVDRRSVQDKYIFGEDTIYVSTDGQGSHTYSYVSSFEFVPNSNVAVLLPKRDMSINEKLYYSLCITINRFKYSYGRKPKGNRLKALLIPNNPPAFIYENLFEDILGDWRKILK
jgi:type I restriction enzyme M protein